LGRNGKDQRGKRGNQYFHQDVPFLVWLSKRDSDDALPRKRAAKTTLTRFISCDEVFRAPPPGSARVEDGQEDVRTPGL
jgi:hypothetical protein